jgi:hypothetical protein
MVLGGITGAVSDKAKSAGGAAAGALGGDIASGNGLDMVTKGLDRAAQVAGGALNDIFGGLPWEMFVQSGDAAAFAADVAVVLA